MDSMLLATQWIGSTPAHTYNGMPHVKCGSITTFLHVIQQVVTKRWPHSRPDVQHIFSGTHGQLLAALINTFTNQKLSKHYFRNLDIITIEITRTSIVVIYPQHDGTFMTKTSPVDIDTADYNDVLSNWKNCTKLYLIRHGFALHNKTYTTYNGFLGGPQNIVQKLKERQFNSQLCLFAYAPQNESSSDTPVYFETAIQIKAKSFKKTHTTSFNANNMAVLCSPLDRAILTALLFVKTILGNDAYVSQSHFVACEQYMKTQLYYQNFLYAVNTNDYISFLIKGVTGLSNQPEFKKFLVTLKDSHIQNKISTYTSTVYKMQLDKFVEFCKGLSREAGAAYKNSAYSQKVYLTEQLQELSSSVPIILYKSYPDLLKTFTPENIACQGLVKKNVTSSTNEKVELQFIPYTFS